MPSGLNYAKWDAIAISDSEDEEKPAPPRPKPSPSAPRVQPKFAPKIPLESPPTSSTDSDDDGPPPLEDAAAIADANAPVDRSKLSPYAYRSEIVPPNVQKPGAKQLEAKATPAGSAKTPTAAKVQAPTTTSPTTSSKANNVTAPKAPSSPTSSRRIDYSKFEHIGSDIESEDEGSSPPKAKLEAVPPKAAAASSSSTAAKATPATSSKAPRAPTTPTKASPKATNNKTNSAKTDIFGLPIGVPPVKGVRIFCDKDKRIMVKPFAATEISPLDPVFKEPVLPVWARLGIPLVMRRVGTTSDDRADLDCQIATYLAINDDNGFADMKWQSYVGTVIVARKDKMPLTPQHLEGLWMYAIEILEAFSNSDNGKINEARWYSPENYKRWWRRYTKEREENSAEFRHVNGIPEPDEDSIDHFSNPGSPYDL